MGLWSVIVPETGTNLVTNPSFETGTTGWSTNATSTIAQSSEQAKFGAYSCKCTYGNSVYILYMAPTLAASTTYYASCWVYVPSNWDNGDIIITQANLSDAVVTENYYYDHGVSPTNQWIYIESKIVTVSDTSGQAFLLLIYGTPPTATRYFYADGMQWVVDDHASTYIDGDQDGCVWNGERHASTSTRKAQSRAGGRVYNLETDYSINVRAEMGIGVPGARHLVQEQAFQPGSVFLGRKVLPRTIDLQCQAKGTDYANLHALRSALWNAIKPDYVAGDQEVILQYTGADSNNPLWIDAVYDSGLEMGNPEMYLDELNLRFIAYNPFWREIGNGSDVLTTKSDVSNANRVLAKIDGTWQALSTGTGGTVYDIVSDSKGNIYICGVFTNLGDANGDYISRWDGSAWNSLGTGLNNFAYGMVVDAADNLYVVGEFTTAGGTTVDNVAKWNGSAWSALGSGGTINFVEGCCIGHDGYLYVVGDFSDMHGTAAADAAYWDGSAWHAMSTGLTGGDGFVVRTGPDGKIWAGGSFTTAGGVTVACISYWDGSAWNAAGSGIADHETTLKVADIAFDQAGNVYITGDFQTAGDNTVMHIAKWNGANWSALGTGLGDEQGMCLEFDPDGNLWVGGSFESAGGLALADRMAIWNGSSWLIPDIDLPGSSTLMTVHTYNQNQYIGFSTSGTAVASHNNTSINNTGSRTTYPIIRLKRSGGTTCGLEYIKNNTSGATMYFDYDLLDGETITIDTRPGRRDIWSDYWRAPGQPYRPGGDLRYLPIWRAMLRGSDFSTFYLLPGNNDISIKVSETGSPTLTMTIQWEVLHWGADSA